MTKKIKILVIFFFLSFFTTSCQTLKDGLQGNKKSNRAEEFLIDKKKPLVLPPDFSILPKPATEEESESKNMDVESLLKKNSFENNIEVKENSNLEKSILEKINNN